LNKSKMIRAAHSGPQGECRVPLLASAAAILVFGLIGAADAQVQTRSSFGTLFGGQSGSTNARKAVPTATTRHTRSKSETKNKRDTTAKNTFGDNLPKGPLQLIVSINEQHAYLYMNGVRIADTRVSTGTHSNPTPTGVFSIIQKNRWHRSNLYGNAPMFYMHRLTWSGVALHEGALPGFAASHGCIRMPTAFVSRLWNISRMGMRVVVSREPLAPRDFSHPKLFTPSRKPADVSVSRADLDGLRPNLGLIRPSRADYVRVAQATATESATATDAGPTAEAPSAAADAPASATAPAADVTTVPAPPALAADPVTTPPVAPTPAAMPTPAANSPAAREPERPAIDPNELQLPRPAPQRARAAEPTKLNGQIAVFISRKEKRIFVRHAFVPLFDMPIEIANPERPIGTHTYTVLEVRDDNARWNVISMPVTPAAQAPAATKGSKRDSAVKHQQKLARRGTVITAVSSNATEALDRVTIPQEAMERIGELLIPGSSLIISDEGLGRETGRYTEFIVETR
jgi:lipoprotein-anchoring transpeptidase ErfK/SrfK